MRLNLAVALVLCAGVVGGCSKGYEVRDRGLWEKADGFAHSELVIDTHIDLPYRLAKKMEDISVRTEGGDFDYVRAREGGLDVAFVAVYVAPSHEVAGDAKVEADKQIELVEGFGEKWGDKFRLVRTRVEIKEGFGDGRVMLALGIENGAPIEGDLANLKYFYDRGVRYITLCHSECNHICDSSYDTERKWGGLSPFGRKLVAAMNKLGMIIDVSHVSDDAFFEIMEISSAPVVATHSGCRKFTPGWERNMSDEMIKLLAEKGGLIQINFGSIFISEEANSSSKARWDHIDKYLADNSELDEDVKQKYVDDYNKKHPVPATHISDVVANIDHAVKLVGVDHVGLGSDFDGVGGNLPDGLRDVSGYRNLVYELMESGYSEEDIAKICGGNFMRVWGEIEGLAQK